MSVRINRLQVLRLEDRVTPSLTPVGAEFRVNAGTTDFQRFADTAMDAAGNFVVAWGGYNSTLFGGDHFGVTASRYNADGTPNGNPIAVGATPTELTNVAVASNSAGQFVVVWDSTDFFTPLKLLAQAYNADGTPRGATVSVASSASFDNSQADVALSEAGDFVIAWTTTSFSANPASYVVARRFSATGSPLTTTVSLYSSTVPQSTRPTVALGTDGSFMAAWGPEQNDTSTGGYRRFSATGSPLMAATPVTTSGNGYVARVYADGTGGYWLSWLARTATNPIADTLYVKRLDAQGTSISAPAVVADNGLFERYYAYDLATMPDGRFVATWGQDAIYARSFLADGSADGASVQVNTFSAIGSYYDPTFNYTGAYQRLAERIAVDADGDAVAAWVSWGQDGSGTGVYSQRLAGAIPRPAAPVTNNGSAQRSKVTSCELDFNRKLTLLTNPADVFMLTGPGGVLPVTVDMSASTPSSTRIKVSYPDLADGRYSLRMFAGLVTDSAGQQLDGNGDGISGDDLVVNFHKLTGDFNGDAHVDGLDFLQFRNAYAVGDLHFDIDGDGFVNASDFLKFRLNFLHQV